ncbi:SPOR domain-containing protein [Rhodobacter sp. Har01]|uniref:SPOR domain-containing protein n=1 Tax=Rhodobacter sp. Har01 TaxID=2883999 RepID=UPI001D071064|nr:SPOR domain-containing protein [Rhodobacter sp. Har01]MCB6177024.1 SPOR domain-containing protein [Rhodobacter sp. Har01]
MADADFDAGHAAFPAQGRGQRIINLAGAAASLGLVVGLGWWGYALAVRDVNGVPVIRALGGAMRIAPEDPGGEVVDHQGLAVNDVVAEGTAAPPADRLVLAPAPVELSLDDGPGLAGATPPLEGEVTPSRLDSDAGGLVPVTPLEGDGALSTDAAVAAALAEALGSDAAPSEDLVEVAALDAAGLPPPEGAVIRSPRPQPRPARSAAPDAAVPTAAAPAAPETVDPATLAPGTRLVQFGAFETEDEARAEWTRIGGRFAALMAGKAMVIESAVSGGNTFFRLRALGFEGEDDARRFCAALTAEGANCIPVAHR